MYNFNETEMKNFADEIKAKTILEMESKQVPIYAGGSLAIEKADKQTKFKTWLRAKYNGDAMVVKAISGSYGTTLPIEFATDMWNLINDYSLAKYCTNYKVGTGQLQVQTLTTKPVVAAVVQGSALSDAGGVNAAKQIDIVKYAAYQMFPKEMLDDNNYDLYGHLLKLFTEAIALKMDADIIASLDAANGATDVAGGGAAVEIALTHVLGAYTGVQTGAMKNAIWAMHRTTFGKILGLTTTSTGVFTNANSLANPTLLGYPVILSDQIAPYVSPVVDNAKWLYFGDFANIGFASRQEMEAELIKEGTLNGAAGVNAVSLAETRQVALIVDARFGSKTIDKSGLVRLTA